jgi:excisionase family DNA binding protein
VSERPEKGDLPDPKAEPTISASRAAELLGIATSTAYEAIHKGEIPCITVGSRFRVPTAKFLRDVLQVPMPGVPELVPEPAPKDGGPSLATLLGFVAVEAIKAGYFDNILPLIMGAAKVRSGEIK